MTYSEQARHSTVRSRKRREIRRIKLRKDLLLVIAPTAVLIVLATAVISNALSAKKEGAEVPFVSSSVCQSSVCSSQEALGRLAPSIQNTSASASETLEPIPVLYTSEDVEYIAKTVYGEALVTNSDMEMAAVVWCILNRVDTTGYACGHDIQYVVTFDRQFHGYNADNPVTRRVEQIVIDVLDRWCAEKAGAVNVGRVLPKGYIYFEGDGRHNYYTDEYLSKEFYEWSLPNPYDN